MYDTGKVALGIFVFLAFMTFPIWYGAVRGEAQAEPSQMAEGRCAAAVDFVRAQGGEVPEESEARARIARIEHMEVLDQWREEVVRQNKRHRADVGPADGHRSKSLSNNCLGCHTNKARFCDTCHTNVGVAPYCWDCHVDPGAVSGR